MPTLLHSSNSEVDPAIRPERFSASTLGSLPAITDRSEPGEPGEPGEP